MAHQPNNDTQYLPSDPKGIFNRARQRSTQLIALLDSNQAFTDQLSADNRKAAADICSVMHTLNSQAYLFTVQCPDQDTYCISAQAISTFCDTADAFIKYINNGNDQTSFQFGKQVGKTSSLSLALFETAEKEKNTANKYYYLGLGLLISSFLLTVATYVLLPFHLGIASIVASGVAFLLLPAAHESKNVSNVHAQKAVFCSGIAKTLGFFGRQELLIQSCRQKEEIAVEKTPPLLPQARG